MSDTQKKLMESLEVIKNLAERCTVLPPYIETQEKIDKAYQILKEFIEEKAN